MYAHKSWSSSSTKTTQQPKKPSQFLSFALNFLSNQTELKQTNKNELRITPQAQNWSPPPHREKKIHGFFTIFNFRNRIFSGKWEKASLMESMHHVI